MADERSFKEEPFFCVKEDLGGIARTYIELGDEGKDVQNGVKSSPKAPASTSTESQLK